VFLTMFRSWALTTFRSRLLARPPLTPISVPREQLGVVAFEALDKVLRLKRQKDADYYRVGGAQVDRFRPAKKPPNIVS
jgi:hypothetical protein